MQAQKQIHASQLWQQGINDVILRSCDTIVLKTLPLVVQCKKNFRWWVRMHETISTKKIAFLIVTFRTTKNSVFRHFTEWKCFRHMLFHGIPEKRDPGPWVVPGPYKDSGPYEDPGTYQDSGSYEDPGSYENPGPYKEPVSYKDSGPL